jgi:hypothetical protein
MQHICQTCVQRSSRPPPPPFRNKIGNCFEGGRHLEGAPTQSCTDFGWAGFIQIIVDRLSLAINNCNQSIPIS